VAIDSKLAHFTRPLIVGLALGRSYDWCRIAGATLRVRDPSGGVELHHR
jgi:hypothetical protein